MCNINNKHQTVSHSLWCQHRLIIFMGVGRNAERAECRMPNPFSSRNRQLKQHHQSSSYGTVGGRIYYTAMPGRAVATIYSPTVKPCFCVNLVLESLQSFHRATLCVARSQSSSSVRLFVCHTRGLCPHSSTYDHDFFTV